jgi:serine/threonine-protein kinase
MLLGRRHITSLNRADELNTELAARVDQLVKRGTEIEQLNEELRRQIGDKSQQIYAALALAGQQRAPSPEPQPGDIVQGRYRIERPIGSGGMGTVYAVTRLSDNRPFALKLARELSGIALARLAREAQIACTMSHRNLVGVIDVDVATSGFLYIVMELVEGASLKEHRSRFGESAWALPILHQLAEGVAALHAAGVVHRDLKPANVLVTTASDGETWIKIADFGISVHAPAEELESTSTRPSAALVDRTQVEVPKPHGVAGSSFLTATGLVPGTPAYLAPELVAGRTHVTAAADMFAFGVIAFELLTGKRPFVEAPATALFQNRPPMRATSIEHAWSEPVPVLVAFIDACLDYDPMRRPDAAQAARVLAGVLER